jgi:hypothetical protein
MLASEELLTPEPEPRDWSYFDDYGYYYHPDFNWRDRDNPCTQSYYLYQDRIVARNMLASNIGLLVKGNDRGDYLVSVNNLQTTQPIAGAQLELLDFQNQRLAAAQTDGAGMAVIEKVPDAHLLIAESNGQFGYLKLDDGSAVSMSMFDVGGQQNKEGLKGFIYGARGVWRPGDTIFLSFMLEDPHDRIPENHPVVLEFYNPQNQLFDRQVQNQGVAGLYAFKLKTPADAPTGNWSCKIKLGGATFYKRIKVETVKPNRLKLSLDFPAEILSAAASNAYLDLQARWLHGAIAGRLKADVEFTLSDRSLGFDQYPDFVFSDPVSEFEPPPGG